MKDRIDAKRKVEEEPSNDPQRKKLAITITKNQATTSTTSSVIKCADDGLSSKAALRTINNDVNEFAVARNMEAVAGVKVSEENEEWEEQLEIVSNP